MFTLSLRFLPRLAVAALLACQQPAAPLAAAEVPASAAPPIEPGPAKPVLKEAGPWSFEFKDPPPGPRAPTYDAFRVKIGTSSFDEVAEQIKALGLECGDTSVRAMMDRRRENEHKRLEAARARGEDAVTSASWMHRRSKREANPQIRFSCPKISSEGIRDRDRIASTGRLLYVFDSYDHPVRHASYQRSYKQDASALKDFQDTVAALTKIYGPPTGPLKTALPTPDEGGELVLPGGASYEVAWEYSDLLVKTTLLRYGKLASVGERVEIPHGLRPDAPRFAAAAPATTATAKLPGDAAPPADAETP